MGNQLIQKPLSTQDNATMKNEDIQPSQKRDLKSQWHCLRGQKP